ncbi:UNKNOWN [Stylonychia lemnae]|uniref:B box-type domain-containing protein n=1 Tax=Stylonychia lemnae TaxID=5949 RepID=A0A078BEK5_STYLE|nr:UNKNOWN [Stylonychia lemnae]|eukprot:CDW91582.1 UNKNOWN [Stylonychia lemnae]
MCQKHQEDAKAFCTICNSLLCVFCLIKDDNEEEAPDHNHKPVNAKTYCNQSKNKWRDLQQRATILDQNYDIKIQELGNLCSTMFKSMSGQPISEEGQAHLEQQMDENKQKVDIVKRFVKDVNVFMEKVEAIEAENRADLMTMFNQKLKEHTDKINTFEKVLSEMSIQKVIEESFGEKGNRETEQNIITEESNQKSVNNYLIKKIHTLEDRVNAKFEKEQSYVKQLMKTQDTDMQKFEGLIKEKELRSEKQYRELRSGIQDIKSQLFEWSNHTIFYRMLFDLQIYKRTELDSRFVEQLLKTKLSDQCIFSMARMPNGDIIVDANKKATIINDSTFEIINQLEPSDSQLVSIGFQKDKMLSHYQSMYNISYQPNGKFYQLANTDTNNWQHCMCVPDDAHIIQGAHGGLLYIYSTQQISYFVQKKCEQIPGGQAILQVIKLSENQKYAVATKGSGLHIMDINLTTYETSRDPKVYLQGKYITDLLEINQNVLLVSSYSDCSYYVVDLNKKEEFFLCKGFSPYGMGISKFPSYSFDNFPYVMAKEDDYMTIINVRAGFSFRLISLPTHNQNYFNQRMIFTNDKTFVTDEGSYYLSKYKMSDQLFKNLKEIHLWSIVNNLTKL